MKTASEFQKRFWSGFNNSDFGNDLEKHLYFETFSNSIRLNVKGFQSQLNGRNFSLKNTK